MNSPASVWLVFVSTDSNDPSPELLSIWSTQEAADAEVERMKTDARLQRYIIEIEERPLDKPF